jgi:predicted nucleotidyltransferase
MLEQDRLLGEIVDRLAAVFRPTRIYLFGSGARGDRAAESDYDLLLLVESPAEPLYRLAQRAYPVLRGIRASVEVLFWDRQTFDSRLHLPASFPATVVREGRLLYGA